MSLTPVSRLWGACFGARLGRFVIFLFGAAGQLEAQTSFINPSGEWNTAANWSAGIPTLGTPATINNTTMTGVVLNGFGETGAARSLTIATNGGDEAILWVENQAELRVDFDLIVGKAGIGRLVIAAQPTLPTIVYSNHGYIAEQAGSEAEVFLAGGWWILTDAVLQAGYGGKAAVNVFGGSISGDSLQVGVLSTARAR